MDQQQIGLKLALDALGISLQLDTFTDRLTVQKCVYLAQAAGVQLGYHFHWYLRGPYSPALTRDAFGVVAELRHNPRELQGWSLDAASLKRLERLREFLPTGTDRAARAQRLELLASVLFLMRSDADQSHDPARLRATLERYGKDFSVDDVREAIEALNRHELGPAAAK